ncbi:hypothetical protein AcW2_005369 [Taiwanofungus camphoratus]|nr:hypothetical protein AcW2_005369 [Antrodia cinnamomea]
MVVSRAVAPDITSTTITVPTSPRMGVMLMEPICVSRWAEDVPVQPPQDHVPWQEGVPHEVEKDSIIPPWIPVGSIFPPEAFRAIFRSRHPEQYNMSSAGHESFMASAKTYEERPFLCDDKTSGLISVSVHSVQDFISGLPQVSDDISKLSVPTIMVSSSTAVLPISLESSHSIARDVPLAVRRGQKMPTPLLLGQKAEPSCELDAYPGIPTPFLGSPSSFSPTFEFATNPAAFSMGLEAMCADLRSRCPELRPTPSTEHSEETHWRTVSSAGYTVNQEEDEWAFAKDLLDQYGSKAPLPTTPQSVPATPDAVRMSDTADMVSFSWATSPTLINSIEQTSPEQTAIGLRQQRRKTVIIETPIGKGDIPSGEGIERGTDNLDDHKPLPFESPPDASFSCTQCHQSTPAQSRPASSASLRPVKGILKEKKSVRFSMAPSRHEYLYEEHVERIIAEPVTKELSLRQPVVSPRQRSPLRQSFSPELHDTPEDVPVKRKCLSAQPVTRAVPRDGLGQPNSPQTPTPVLITEQRYAPLRSSTVRQSLPVKRKSQVVDQNPCNGVTPDDISRPKRLEKAASTPIPPRAVQGAESPRSTRNRSSSVQKSRMPVPFRTILTKFRT